MEPNISESFLAGPLASAIAEQLLALIVKKVSPESEASSADAGLGRGFIQAEDFAVADTPIYHISRDAGTFIVQYVDGDPKPINGDVIEATFLGCSHYSKPPDPTKMRSEDSYKFQIHLQSNRGKFIVEAGTATGFHAGFIRSMTYVLEKGISVVGKKIAISLHKGEMKAVLSELYVDNQTVYAKGGGKWKIKGEEPINQPWYSAAGKLLKLVEADGGIASASLSEEETIPTLPAPQSAPQRPQARQPEPQQQRPQPRQPEPRQEFQLEQQVHDEIQLPPADPNSPHILYSVDWLRAQIAAARSTTELALIRRWMTVTPLKENVESVPVVRDQIQRELENAAIRINLETLAQGPDIADQANEAIIQIDVEMRRIGWTRVHGREHLQKVYGKASRMELTDSELLEFLMYLEQQPDNQIA